MLWQTLLVGSSGAPFMVILLTGCLLLLLLGACTVLTPVLRQLQSKVLQLESKALADSTHRRTPIMLCTGYGSCWSLALASSCLAH